MGLTTSTPASEAGTQSRLNWKSKWEGQFKSVALSSQKPNQLTNSKFGSRTKSFQGLRTLCCRIRTARSLLGLVAAYPRGFLIWMDFFIFYPCGSYLDGFLQKWPTPAVIIRALKCLVMLLSGWDFLCLTPDVIILAVVLQKNPVLLLFRPCAQSSSIEYYYYTLSQ